MESLLSYRNSECEALKDPSYLELVISMSKVTDMQSFNSLILVGLLISYLPQHYRIISRGTAEGISPYFVLLGTTSATSGFANILTVPQSRAAIGCCKELEAFQCTAGLLGVAQLGTQWVCFTLILVLFLIFFRYRDATIPSEELAGESPKWQTAVGVGLACVVHGLLVVIITGIFTIALPNHLTAWANFLGVMATVLAAIQYFPQIWTTYHLKHVGSLSIPMMCIQTPGGLLFAASLYARLGPKGWSTWAIYLLTAIMQGCVLVLGIYYEMAARHHERQQSNQNADGTYSSLQNSAPPRPSLASRTYSEGWERGLPGPFTGHPERYAETEEDLDDIQEREQRAIERENQPLLRPGGIGNPRKNYRTTKKR
ncbi:PQ loop repeat protein, partial [Metarhizium brunneum ARSEF 3297]